MNTFSRTLLSSSCIMILALSVVLHAGAQTTGQFDVILSSPEPVYSWRDIPYNDASPKGNFPFQKITWLPGGYFLATGECADGRDGTQFEKGGLYLLSDTGTYLATRDVCFDSSERVRACYEGGGCYIGTKILPTGTGSFVQELQPPQAGIARSPITYSVNGSSIDLQDRIFFNDEGTRWKNGADIGKGTTAEFRYSAVANGVLVGVETVSTGNDRYEIFNSIYSLPGLSRITKSSVRFYPIVGIGNYIIASNNPTSDTVKVYRVPDQNALSRGELPSSVQTLATGRVFGYAVDAQNPNRIALYTSTGSISNGTLRVYTVGTNGLDLESERNLTNTTGSAALDYRYPIALSGEYLAYSSCHGSDPAKSSASCELIVEKNDQKLSVEPLPKSAEDVSQWVHSLALSANGNILVGLEPLAGGEKENGELYLYTIRGAQTAPFPSGTTTPNTQLPGNGIVINGTADYFAIAQSYITLLQALLNVSGNPPVAKPQGTNFQSTSLGASVPGTTVLQPSQIFQQFIDLINGL